jgi:transcriptional regulator with XRE-family HTH domain
MDIISELKRIRKEKGLSKYKLGKLSGVFPHGLENIEKGKSDPRLRTIQNIADALGYEIVLREKK